MCRIRIIHAQAESEASKECDVREGSGAMRKGKKERCIGGRLTGSTSLGARLGAKLSRCGVNGCDSGENGCGTLSFCSPAGSKIARFADATGSAVSAWGAPAGAGGALVGGAAAGEGVRTTVRIGASPPGGGSGGGGAAAGCCGTSASLPIAG